MPKPKKTTKPAPVLEPIEPEPAPTPEPAPAPLDPFLSWSALALATAGLPTQ